MFAAALDVAATELEEVVLMAGLVVAMALEVGLAAALDVALTAALVEVLATELLLLLARP